MNDTPPSADTPGGLEQKLDSILMPYAAGRRDKLKACAGKFVHYTSADSGLKIINTRTLWMRSTTAMSDYSEVQHGYQRLGEHPNTQILLSTLDQSLGGLGREARELFSQWWATNDIQLQTYVASISEHLDEENEHGRLSMWRAFARTSARVALVLRIPLVPSAAQSLRVLFSPVAYFTSEQLGERIAEVIQKVKANEAYLQSVDRQQVLMKAFFMLLLGVVCLKHEGFVEEREWRIIYYPKRLYTPLIPPASEVIDGVPQIVYKLPLEIPSTPELPGINIPSLIDRVIIGPNQYPLVMSEVFVEALRSAGVPDAERRVYISRIPIRT